MTLSTSAVAVCCFIDFAQLILQPRILGRDGCLIGKCSNEFWFRSTRAAMAPAVLRVVALWRFGVRASHLR